MLSLMFDANKDKTYLMVCSCSCPPAPAPPDALMLMLLLPHSPAPLFSVLLLVVLLIPRLVLLLISFFAVCRAPLLFLFLSFQGCSYSSPRPPFPLLLLLLLLLSIASFQIFNALRVEEGPTCKIDLRSFSSCRVLLPHPSQDSHAARTLRLLGRGVRTLERGLQEGEEEEEEEEGENVRGGKGGRK